VTSASYANELVLSQLSFQLPQNSGARGKGNWPLEAGRLQSFTSCPISWRRDMTSKRALKLKSGIHEEMAKSSELEVHPSRSKVYAKVQEREARRLRSCPIRHRTQLLLLSPQAGASLYLLKPASRGAFPSTLKPDELARNVLLGWWLP
jgi:hypothetical protein